ncbi:energy-coupling factor ABC transporter ATP-binding protein [Chamaesiphon minutus]|uniref:ABC-type cobalt transport system, ATPase component n=1 Tax=Chamaesiphon minutus (strain ATCC 27169 / PCC 6605) TaxID=1173020 RepID=K9UPF0_CHAP6|nr:ABC transporter ATP-binding protein [Chamaesiphon minutus]AFY96695.1 ABC-type cobalt transport system, ATPase component [Chamaesiphon minutus PCC 6605]
MSEYLLEFQDIYYSYPMATAPTLQGLSLRLPKYKKTALIGQNGCGKSTMFLIADGLVKPDRGVVTLDNLPLSFDRAALKRWRQRVGLVFQDPEQQLVAPTVAADISYGLYNQGLSEAKVAAKVTQTLSDFNLKNLAMSPLQHLSLGQKKRVSIAGVMALKPDLLLLDEPTAYLDPVQTRNLLTELESIAKLGTTLLIATHDLDFVYQWADWVLVMERGRLIAEGETITVFTQLQSMPDFALGMPILWQMWSRFADKMPSVPAPRSIDEFTTYLEKYRFKN